MTFSRIPYLANKNMQIQFTTSVSIIMREFEVMHWHFSTLKGIENASDCYCVPPEIILPSSLKLEEKNISVSLVVLSYTQETESYYFD